MGETRSPPVLEPQRAAVRARIARAHGHLHGVLDMIDDGRSYPEVLQQITAVRRALEKATAVIVEDMLDGLQEAPQGDGKLQFEALRAAVRTLA